MLEGALHLLCGDDVKDVLQQWCGYDGDERVVPKVNDFAVGESTAGRCSPLAVTGITDEGTIRTSRGKACYKSPYLARQLLVFFASVRYMVVKIACSYSEIVLRTTKHTIVYLGFGPS
jgi:hypothetical protein